MRRLVTLISIVLMAVSASAQEPELPVTDGLKLIAEKDWTKETEYNGWMIFNDDEMIFPEIVDEGLALTNPEVQAQIWTPQEYVLDDFSLEQDHDYIVRLFLKVPSDGTYQVVMGSWATNVNVQVPVTARDDFQVIDVEFPDFSRGAESAEGLETCHVLLQCGWVVGTTILKKVEVYEVLESSVRDNTTGIKAVKASKSDDTIYNLAGQRVDASYKGVVIKNGKKYIMR